VIKEGMAAQYTEISLEEMHTFLKRAFWALKPIKQGVARDRAGRGEIFFDLTLSRRVAVRVYSSVPEHSSMGQGLGQDAIRVGLFSAQGKPLQGGKLPIVKRTQGWRDSLKDKVEFFMERYEAAEDDLEAGRFVDWSKISV
jgi:hypothetical protein